MEKNEQAWRSDLKKVFENFKHSYVEDAKDEAKMENEDVSIQRDYESKTYNEFEDYIVDYICEFFERNES